jgi:hypothetical protein
MSDLIKRVAEALEGATPGQWRNVPNNQVLAFGAYGKLVCDSSKRDAALIALAPDMARVVLASEEMAKAFDRWKAAQGLTECFDAYDEVERAFTAYRAAVDGKQ